MFKKVIKVNGLNPGLLKRPRHKNFAVLGQFCAKLIILLGAFTHTQNAPEKSISKISNEFCQGEPEIICFWC